MNVGTVLFSSKDIQLNKKWDPEEILLLKSRKLMDSLIPKTVVKGKVFLNYVKIIFAKTETIENPKTKKIVLIGLSDVLGGYLDGVMLMHVKKDYYNGDESFDVTNQLHIILRKIKCLRLLY